MNTHLSLNKNVYTVNDESQHLLVFGVPQIKLKDDLHRLASKFGIIKSLTVIDNYPKEDDYKFTDVYHLHYRRIQAARFAKRQLDERCFFGSVLHACYAPELETLAETRIKLIQRRREIAARIRMHKNADTDIKKTRTPQRSRKHPALPLTEERFSQCGNFSNPPGSSSIIGASGSQEFNASIKPSSSLLQISNETYGQIAVFQPNHPNITTAAEFSDQHFQPQPKCIEGVSKNVGGIEAPSFSNGIVSPCQLSDDQIKTLCFIPRQIVCSVTKVTKSKKRIVFHNKR
ncbi:uncharacterized protein LOC142319611 isoform X2 [Lycorma delicatula]|uniref:uncharacterized protein LOC142319611 isoform X2 n=1 Tax=Lycorma delicatula TaxID=130591 RepID=UPI003F514BC9